MVQDKENIKKLSSDSVPGKWVARANFAVIILTDPKYFFQMIDAGRAVQSMMFAAWSFGVASGIYINVDTSAMKQDYALPSNLSITTVVGFGIQIRK